MLCLHRIACRLHVMSLLAIPLVYSLEKDTIVYGHKPEHSMHLCRVDRYECLCQIALVLIQTILDQITKIVKKKLRYLIIMFDYQRKTCMAVVFFLLHVERGLPGSILESCSDRAIFFSFDAKKMLQV